MHYYKLLGSDNRAFWENREALDKYMARLKELMEEDEKLVTNKKTVMNIEISIKGMYSDGQPFSYSFDSIDRAISEMEMIEVNEHAFDHLQNKTDATTD